MFKPNLFLFNYIFTEGYTTGDFAFAFCLIQLRSCLLLCQKTHQCCNSLFFSGNGTLCLKPVIVLLSHRHSSTLVYLSFVFKIRFRSYHVIKYFFHCQSMSVFFMSCLQLKMCFNTTYASCDSVCTLTRQLTIAA